MILSKNKELDKIVDDFASTSKTNINPLSMILNGVIDANVNGGIANYQSVSYLFLIQYSFALFVRLFVRLLAFAIYNLYLYYQREINYYYHFINHCYKWFLDSIGMSFLMWLLCWTKLVVVMNSFNLKYIYK